MLLYRPDPKELLSLTRLARGTEGRVLIQVLKAELDVVKERLLVDEANFQLLQGRGQFLKGMIDLLVTQATKEAPL